MKTETVERAPTKQELLIAARRAQKPLPLAAHRTAFACICGHLHTREFTSRAVVPCACGRSWVPIGGSA